MAARSDSPPPVSRQPYTVYQQAEYTNNGSARYQPDQSPSNHPLVKRVDDLFKVGHQMLVNFLNCTPQLAALFVGYQTFAQIATLVPKNYTNRIPQALSQRISAIPFGNMVKFFGMFLVFKAALDPLLKRILTNPDKMYPIDLHANDNEEEAPFDKEDAKNRCIRLLVPLMVTYCAAESRHLKVNLAYAVLASTIGSMFMNLMAKKVDRFYTRYEEFINKMLSR